MQNIYYIKHQKHKTRTYYLIYDKTGAHYVQIESQFHIWNKQIIGAQVTPLIHKIQIPIEFPFHCHIHLWWLRCRHP